MLDTDDVNTDAEEDETTTKKKNKSVNYGKISAAIGESKSKGIVVLPPDINESDLIFKPELKRNAIIYGMKGINRIGTALVYEIFNKRPYTSIEDFLSKVKVNKLQMFSLIKAGAFDELCNNDRIKAMSDYIASVADQKKRITLQNMQMLIAKGMIPEKLDFQRRLFNFNKYVKTSKDGIYYYLDENAMPFYETNFDTSKIEEIIVTNEGPKGKIKMTTWDNIYKKGMDPVRDWMKANQQEILNDLNGRLMQEVWDKYGQGSIADWEMDSLGFYYHEHPLKELDNSTYNISDYFSLDEEPLVEREFTTKEGSEITMFKIYRIAGTVIDKDKNKSSVILLTPTGVVTIKVWKNQFAAWDKQISERGADGVKHVVEKSWFNRGNKLIITGIRRGDTFIPKKYKNTPHELFTKIEEIENGFITKYSTERVQVDE